MQEVKDFFKLVEHLGVSLPITALGTCKFFYLEGGSLFKEQCLLNLYHFCKVIILFCNKTIRRTNHEDVPKQNLSMTLQLELSHCLSDNEFRDCKLVKKKIINTPLGHYYGHLLRVIIIIIIIIIIIVNAVCLFSVLYGVETCHILVHFMQIVWWNHVTYTFLFYQLNFQQFLVILGSSKWCKRQ